MGCSPCTGRKVVESHGTQFTPPLDPPIVRISPESSSISVKSRDTRKAAPAPGPVITMDRVDVSSMTRVAETTTFDEEIQGPISLDIDGDKIDPPDKSKRPKSTQRQARENPWKEKYFVHGELSEIVAHLESKTHGCTASSIPEEIEQYLQLLHTLNLRATDILKKQTVVIASKEKSRIEQVTIQRDLINKTLIGNSNCYAKQCDEYYRKIIEEFIRQIEVEMSIYLDRLQQFLQEDRDRIFRESTKNIQMISTKADKARQTFHSRLQKEILDRRQRIHQKIDEVMKSLDKQSVGYEQMNKINLSIYSTVGHKERELICDKIPERDKFAKDIDGIRNHQPMIKRTVFLQNDQHGR